MSLSEDYGPCQHCGTMTDSGVCSSDCADALDDLRSPQPCATCHGEGEVALSSLRFGNGATAPCGTCDGTGVANGDV